jgi:hypothetical protein
MRTKTTYRAFWSIGGAFKRGWLARAACVKIGGMSRSERLIEDIRREFSDFALVPKRSSRIQRAIGVGLRIVTLGGQRHYVSRYHTVFFGRLYVADAWESMGDDARYVLLRHERVHLRQRRRMGDFVMAWAYLFPLLPIGLAWGRARIEWEAYVETMRATKELFGLRAARELEPEIVRRFVGPDYAWMWPFPKTVRRWFQSAIAEIEAGAVSPGGDVVKADGDGGRWS